MFERPIWKLAGTGGVWPPTVCPWYFLCSNTHYIYIRRPPRCKGSAPKKWGWDGCGRHHLADEVATSTEAAPGNGIIASSFFRASERNVRHFCGRWFSQVWAWILLGFCCFATTLYWAPWGCFGAMLQRVLCGWSGHFHGGWPQAMASLHHLSLGPQNATLGTFAGVGFRRFGLESCWGSAVSQPRSTELLGAVSELCSREFFADDVATSTEAAPGNGIIASSFFRASERNVRQFCGRWFLQVWAWILLGFCCFATTLYWAPWACFGAMLQSSLRMKWPLPRGPLQAMASLHHLSLGPQNATLGTFAGVGFRRFGLESCWGSAVSQPRSTELLGAVSELCSKEFLADEVATSTEAAPGNGIIASSFFRASERNVRHFCGRWFSQVWAWILLGFWCFATTHY